uniref:Uncharacterized protein n=1 Tax=Podarcis muralis TaxID=64176 RepID=A0A670JJS3_PODMU
VSPSPGGSGDTHPQTPNFHIWGLVGIRQAHREIRLAKQLKKPKTLSSCEFFVLQGIRLARYHCTAVPWLSNLIRSGSPFDSRNCSKTKAWFPIGCRRFLHSIGSCGSCVRCSASQKHLQTGTLTSRFASFGSQNV